MPTQYRCNNERRRQAMLAHATLNGIDFLEVLDRQAPDGSPRQRTLLVRFVKALTSSLDAENVRISGGVRVTPVRVDWAGLASDAANLFAAQLIDAAERDFFSALPNPQQVLLVRTSAAGDYSTYRLCLVSSLVDDRPPATFDPLLACVDFSFKVECPNPFDCRTEVDCPPERFPEPQIDYLARDYASFRRLMLDRLAQTLPDWRERNPADQGIVLVELLAHAADQLSYFLDSVATEAYLGTARRRVSLRRHARLLDYPMHEGCNARAWIYCEVDAQAFDLPRGTPLLTRLPGQSARIGPESYVQVLRQRPLVFETMHDITLHAAHNAISFYTWGAQECCLPKGATSATVAGALVDLSPGDVLIFEEVLSPANNNPSAADPTHRHAVRLTEVNVTEDPLGGQFRSQPTDDPEPITEITWAVADALPFPLCISATIDGVHVEDISIARGNIVLADHGRTIVDERLPAPLDGKYAPLLAEPDLAHLLRYTEEAQGRPANTTLAQDPRAALPAITLHTEDNTWSPRRDLLDSDRFERGFVVEMNENRQARLRFGDGVTERQPESNLRATYRVGSGRAGNVGAEALAHIVTLEDAIVAVRNLLPAQGGIEPEPLEQVRQYAPQAFRVQERAVTAADYAALAERHPEVQKAAATRRWTGSWYTMFLTIDRRGGQPVDAEFEAELRDFMERFRLAGHDLEIAAPRFVPLDIALKVCVAPGYFRDVVQQALLETFGSGDLLDGRRGFFHPDNFTFGQPVYLSQVIAAAIGVPGVGTLLDVGARTLPPIVSLLDLLAGGAAGRPRRHTNRFQRWGQGSRGELAAGLIAVGPTEIVRLDNDPNQPENGRIEFFMEGGL